MAARRATRSETLAAPLLGPNARSVGSAPPPSAFSRTRTCVGRSRTRTRISSATARSAPSVSGSFCTRAPNAYVLPAASAPGAKVTEDAPSRKADGNPPAMWSPHGTESVLPTPPTIEQSQRTVSGNGAPVASRASSGSRGFTRRTTGASAKSARKTPLSAPASRGLDSALMTTNASEKKRAGLSARAVRRRHVYVSPARSVRRGTNSARLVSVRRCDWRSASVGKSPGARTGPSTSCHAYVKSCPTSSWRNDEHAWLGRCASASTMRSSARRASRTFSNPETPNTRALGIGYIVLFTATVANATLPTKSVTFAVNVYTTPGSRAAASRRTTG